MLNELAQSGQVNAHNFQYETVALARECEAFVKGSDWSRSTFSTLYRRVKEHVAGQYGRGQGLYKLPERRRSSSNWKSRLTKNAT